MDRGRLEMATGAFDSRQALEGSQRKIGRPFVTHLSYDHGLIRLLGGARRQQG
jgi:hypothetical protein